MLGRELSVVVELAVGPEVFESLKRPPQRTRIRIDLSLPRNNRSVARKGHLAGRAIRRLVSSSATGGDGRLRTQNSDLESRTHELMVALNHSLQYLVITRDNPAGKGLMRHL